MNFFYSKRPKAIILVVLGSLLFQSCSSLFYSDKQRLKNNSFSVVSNYENYRVQYAKDKESQVILSQNHVQIPKLKRKNTFFTFSHDGCYDLSIKVKRQPRISAVLIDLPFSFFYLAPYAIDIFRSDFYKIAKRDRVVILEFKRTPEYFKERISLSLATSDLSILDSLLLESPNDSVRQEIDNVKIRIYKNNILKDIQVRRNNFDYYTIENFNYFKNKYEGAPIESMSIIDSVRTEIQNKEVERIKTKIDLERIIQLQKISDSSFINLLIDLKPTIEKEVLNKIANDFDFYRLNNLISIESPENVNKLSVFKKELENKAIVQITKYNDIILLKSIYTYVGNETKGKLDALKPEVEKYNQIKLLKNKIEEIRIDIAASDYNKALERINKAYPNSFPSNSPENIIIKELLVKVNSNIRRSSVALIIDESQKDMENGVVLGDISEWRLRQLLNNQLECKFRYEGPDRRPLDGRDSTYYVTLSSTEITSAQKQEISEILKGFEKNKQIWLKEKQEIDKQWNEIRTHYGVQNSDNESTTSDNKTKLLSYCHNQMTWDGSGRMTLSLYDKGISCLEIDGQFFWGTWVGQNGSDPSQPTKVTARTPKGVIILSASYVGSSGSVDMFTDSKGNTWQRCF